MIPGLPIINFKESFRFRTYVNAQLNQHAHVAATFFPEWINVKELRNQDVNRAALIPIPREDISFGLYLLVIREDGLGSLVTLLGTCCFAIGSVEIQSSNGGIMLVHYSRGKSDSFMGGTLSILDVFAYDGINFTEKPIEERMKFMSFLDKAVILPSRYKIQLSTQVSPLQAKNLSSFLVYVHLKNNS